MATPVTDLLINIRVNITDQEQQIGFTDDDLMGWVNSASRFIRRLILDYKPIMLAGAPITGTITKGQEQLELANTPIKIIDFRIAKDRITGISVDTIDDLTETGKPTNYYILGSKTVCFYPVPDADYTYRLVVVNEAERLTAAGASPYPTDFDDLLVEYVTIRAQLRNEFSMDQELQIMSVVHDQLKQILSGMEVKTTLVRGYFDAITDNVRSY